ncbi:glycosyltransferase family 39 protein [bacterium]|nr:glycosyltransferase family 39 protein [bacterium]
MKRIFDSKYTIILLFIIAAVLLFADLDCRDFWSDEIFSLPKTDNLRIVLAQSSFDVHPPFYFFLVYFWTDIFGKTETAVRSLSAIFALLAVFVFYRMAKVILPEYLSKIYLLILTISPFFIFYSRMNRYYSLTALLSIIVIYFFYRFQREREFKWEALFWLFSLILIYTDYIGIILLFSLGLYYLWFNRREKRLLLRFIIGTAILAVFYIPWINNLFSQTEKGSAPYTDIQQETRDFRIIGFVFTSLKDTIKRLFYTIYNFTLGETVFPWNPIIASGAAGSLILFIASIRKKENNGQFLLFTLILPFIIYLGCLVFYTKVFSASNFALLPSKIMFLQPLWLMFLIRGYKPGNKLLQTAIILLVFFNIYALVNYYRGEQYLNPKYIVPWRNISFDLVRNYQTNDLIVTDESPLLHYLRDTGVECYGLVDVEEYIAEKEKPFNVYLVLRRRGERSIYIEGARLREYLDRTYLRSDFKGYISPGGEIESRLWEKMLGEKIDYLVEFCTYKIAEPDEGKEQ